MGKIYDAIDELVGHTPLMELRKIEKQQNCKARVLAKLEYFNPAGSTKDRIAKAMLREARVRGELKEGGTIIEPTSGNTGIGLAALGSAQGYHVIIVMPDSMSEERKKMIRAYGAELVLTDGTKGMTGAVEKAKELKDQIPGSILAGQFENPANPKMHFETTGPEIWEDTDGKIDIFVAGIGTGGTITGVGGYLKGMNPQIKVVAVEPKDSPLLSEGRAGSHKLQGIGANFVPEILDRGIYDEIWKPATEDAYEMGRLLARQEGILVGITSGAAAWAAFELAKKPENEGKIIVAFLPDSGERYLSTPDYL